MNIAFVSVERFDNYIETTLSDLFASVNEPVTVDIFVGCANDRYLDKFRGDSRITIHGLSLEESTTIASWNVYHRCAFNHWRALNYYATKGTAACICEDDVIFCNNFFARLRETIREIELARQRYVLSVYSYYDLTKYRCLDRAQYYSVYYSFWGLQGMYYPATILPELEAYFKKQTAGKPTVPADFIVRNFCLDEDFLFGTRQSLIQHIGRSTTGLGPFHTAPNFDKNYDPNRNEAQLMDFRENGRMTRYSKEERALYAAVTSAGAHRYLRTDKESKLIRFKSNFTIDNTPEGPEHWWDLATDGRTARLQLLADEGVVCELMLKDDGALTGIWKANPSTQLVLIPVNAANSQHSVTMNQSNEHLNYKS